MDKIYTTIKERILYFLENNEVSKKFFFEKTGIAPSNFKGLGLKSEIGGDKIVKILSDFPEVSPEWLLTGKGSMLRTGLPSAIKATTTDVSGRRIPLVYPTAVAGFGNNNFSLSESDIKEFYIIPKFKFLNIDFMVEIYGSSMYPKYNSGDVIACTILNDRKFIQWNKCHLIATHEQGLLVKRLHQSKKQGNLTAISDNKEYPPFDIPLSEITGIALIVGVIRLE